MPGIFDAYFEALHQLNAPKTTVKQTPGFLWSGLDHVDDDQIQRRVDDPTASRLDRVLNIQQEIMETLREELEVLKLSDQCGYCGVTYTRNQNIGTFRCRWHPNEGSHPSTYACCGQSKRQYTHSGCVPCDHSAKFNAIERWTASNRTLNVPLVVAMQYRIDPSHYTVHNQNDLRLAKAIVRRC